MKYDQCKTCRRLGQKLFLKGERCLSPKCAMIKRATPPGHERKRRGGSASEYKKLLNEKQSLKKWYGLSERQFKRYVLETLKKMGRVDDVSLELIRRLEKRLDNVIFRLGFAKSRAGARQLVSHGHFLINQKPVNIPSYQVKKGDVISIKPSKIKKAGFAELENMIKKQESPAWLSLDKTNFEARCIGEPNAEEVNPPAEVPLIFEFYSR